MKEKAVFDTKYVPKRIIVNLMYTTVTDNFCHNYASNLQETMSICFGQREFRLIWLCADLQLLADIHAYILRIRPTIQAHLFP